MVAITAKDELVKRYMYLYKNKNLFQHYVLVEVLKRNLSYQELKEPEILFKKTAFAKEMRKYLNY